jgi:peptidyl-prolyl cis-trans isomerase C
MRQVAARLFCAAALALGAAAAVAGCGDSDNELPEGAVARVGDVVITKSDFERARKVASDRTNPRNDGSKARAMEALIKAEWMRQEAEARHITVTDAEVHEAVEEGRKTGFSARKTCRGPA